MTIIWKFISIQKLCRCSIRGESSYFSIQVVLSFFPDLICCFFPLLLMNIPGEFPYMARILAVSLSISWITTWEYFNWTDSLSWRSLSICSLSKNVCMKDENSWLRNNHCDLYKQYQRFQLVSGRDFQKGVPLEKFWRVYPD